MDATIHWVTSAQFVFTCVTVFLISIVYARTDDPRRQHSATYKASKGSTVSELQELLGHERPETSLIYTHMALDPRQLMLQTG
jgi:hypothetical protein